MSLVVVGSIAFDAVQTPFGQREKMLGGSAVHFSLAASFFTDVRVVGPVGDDFGDDEYGAALFTADSFYALPAYPLESVNDPTGAGDTFAGGFLGYLDAQGSDAASDPHVLRRAMVYGATLASFNVEEFGTERVRRLTRDEIDERFEEFRSMTTLERQETGLRPS